MITQLDNPNLRKSNMLNVVCNSTTRGSCLDFGYYREQINMFFDNYLLSSPYVTNIKKIGSKSSNGFILQTEYNKNNYKSYSIIKCNRKPTSDNLLYEYYVGINFINQFVPIFPCFIETYKQLYMFNDDTDFSFAESITNVPIVVDDSVKQHFKEIKNAESMINTPAKFAKNACKFGKTNSISIMLQHFDNLVPLGSYGSTYSDIYDIPNFLFQVYFVLNNMKDEYTHYDLHANNVSLYKPYLGDRYIVMNYHFNDGTIIEFPTEYIAKIIDYGRNFFRDNVKNKSSEQLLIYVCNTPECNAIINGINYPCGDTSGIFAGEYGYPAGTFHYISPDKKNISNDLRLIKSDEMLEDMLKSMGGQFTMEYVGNFGTPERTDATIPGESVKNVFNMLDYIKTYITSWNNSKFVGFYTKALSSEDNYNKYASPKWVNMGTIHVYEDRRPYEFIPTVM